MKIFISQEDLNSLPTSISSRTVLLAGMKNLKKLRSFGTAKRATI
jgi:hypothetical protein